jgi:phosphomannomutase
MLAGRPVSINTTDGVRIAFDSDEIIHLRPSGNAPELRCYNEAASEGRAKELNATCMEIMEQWRR